MLAHVLVTLMNHACTCYGLCDLDHRVGASACNFLADVREATVELFVNTCVDVRQQLSSL